MMSATRSPRVDGELSPEPGLGLEKQTQVGVAGAREGPRRGVGQAPTSEQNFAAQMARRPASRSGGRRSSELASGWARGHPPRWGGSLEAKPLPSHLPRLWSGAQPWAPQNVTRVPRGVGWGMDSLTARAKQQLLGCRLSV